MTNDFSAELLPRVDGDETNGFVLGADTIYCYILCTCYVGTRWRAFDDDGYGGGSGGGGEYALPVFRLDSLTMGVGRCTRI